MRLRWLLSAVCVGAVAGGGSSASLERHGGYATAGGVQMDSYGGESATVSHGYSGDEDAMESAPSSAPSPMPAMPPMARTARPASGPSQYAQVTTSPNTPPSDGTATDAVTSTGPLLIYEAHLYLAVFKVQENLKSVAELGRQAGGYLSRQDDRSIVIRIPAAKFQEFVTAIEALGDVLHRQVQATDVSEEFRDVEIRMRNAVQVRDRLAELLQRAQTVPDSLQIERELERITGEIERLKGRLRFLQDRIAYSTVTVSFQPKEQEQIQPQSFRLPFPWLDSLGLQRLLSL